MEISIDYFCSNDKHTLVAKILTTVLPVHTMRVLKILLLRMYTMYIATMMTMKMLILKTNSSGALLANFVVEGIIGNNIHRSLDTTLSSLTHTNTRRRHKGRRSVESAIRINPVTRTVFCWAYSWKIYTYTYTYLSFHQLQNLFFIVLICKMPASRKPL